MDRKYKGLRNWVKGETGMALPWVLIFTIILTITWLAFLEMAGQERISVQRKIKKTRAFYLAEAGIEKALVDLRQDFVNDPPDPNWADGDINAYGVGPGDEFYSLYGDPSPPLGGGTYDVELKNVKNDGIWLKDEIWIKSTGTVKDLSKTVQVYAKIDSVSPWNNAIFAGTGAAGGTVIDGNVKVSGSVHILGSNLTPSDAAINMSGTAKISNNYNTMSDSLRNRIPDLPKTTFDGEEVETLRAMLRVKHGKVNLSGTATVGEPNVSWNSYKETMDGVYVSDGYGGEKGETNVYSDNGTSNSYDLGDNVTFPSLSDSYLGYPSYQEYLRANALVISDSADLAKFADITPKSEFSYSGANGSISMDGEGNLDINGIVYIDGGDLNMSRPWLNRTITYRGKGSIFVTGNAEIKVNLRTPNMANSFPANVLGIMTPNDITFDAAQIDVMGAFYAESTIICRKQTDIVGTLVSNYFAMGTDVPSVYQVPELARRLPPGVIFSAPIWVVKTTNWQEL